MRNTYSAGGVVLNRANQVYLIHKVARDEWAFPKGRIEESESKTDAAKRETEEETGLSNLKLLFEEPIDRFSYIKNKDEGAEPDYKTVYMFLFRANYDIQKRTVQMEEEGLEGRWLSFEEAINITKLDNVKSTLKKAYEKVKGLH
jgi:bis(5'-nucleosidyl)-tetraphosphatase